MNKKLVLITGSILFVMVIYIYIFPVDIQIIEQTILKYGRYAEYIFLGTWIFRVPLLLPSTPIVIFGGIIFSPIKGFLLSSVGLLLSSTTIFILAKYAFGQNLHNYLFSKHMEITQLLKVYNVKILALGMLNPLVPADIVCFLAAAWGMKFRTYIIVIILANTPLRILYSYLGFSFQDSQIGILLSIGSIFLVCFLSINMWKTYKTQLYEDY